MDATVLFQHAQMNKCNRKYESRMEKSPTHPPGEKIAAWGEDYHVGGGRI